LPQPEKEYLKQSAQDAEAIGRHFRTMRGEGTGSRREFFLGFGCVDVCEHLEMVCIAALSLAALSSEENSC
jgi:hypothetical protein